MRTTNLSRLTAGLAGAGCLILAGCGTSTTGADIAGERDLPLVAVGESSDAPSDLPGVYESSDVVIVGTLVDVKPQRRYYGPDPEDDPNQDDLIEDVTLVVQVESTLKGTVEDRVEVSWSAYKASGRQVSDRVAQLVVGNVTLNERQVGGRYLMFLREFGEPWGNRPANNDAGVMELDTGGVVSGQVSTAFEPYRGESIDDVLRQATEG